jgi:transcriptional antiterminator Rof (Rho-off)
MGHMVTRCDFLDVLEESVVFHAAVAVELHDGTRFEDRTREVVTQDGEEVAIFDLHGEIPVSSIKSARRAQPHEDTYAGKRVVKHDAH